MTRRPFIPLRRPVFIGCEGESEAAYAACLQILLRDADLPVHLVIHPLGRGAGDPLSRVQLAVQRLERLRQSREAPPERFLFLDADQTERDQGRAEAARRLAAQHNIRVIWQLPCFEAVLLRHLPTCDTRRPPDTAEALRALEREWPDYRKPMPSAALNRRIDREAVCRAARVEPDLDALLRCLGVL